MATVVYDPAGNLLGYRRTIAAIYSDLAALDSARQTAVWNDLNLGTPKKYLADDGNNAGAIGVMDWVINKSGSSPTATTDARLRIASMYVQDNPQYLDGVTLGGLLLNVKGYDPIAQHGGPS